MKTKINVALLLRVADQISKTPEQFNMNDWDCGTTACIAGWALRLEQRNKKNKMRRHTELWRRPARLLGLNYSQSLDLFAYHNWPLQFRSSKNDTPAEQAAKAVTRIHAFLDEHSPDWRAQQWGPPRPGTASRFIAECQTNAPGERPKPEME